MPKITATILEVLLVTTRFYDAPPGADSGAVPSGAMFAFDGSDTLQSFDGDFIEFFP